MNLEFGGTVKLTLTPMAGVVTGQTDGAIAGVKVNLACAPQNIRSRSVVAQP